MHFDKSLLSPNGCDVSSGVAAMSRNWTVMSDNLVTFSPTSPVGGGCPNHLRLLGSGGGPDSGKAGDVDSGIENVALRLVHAHVEDTITTVAAHPALQSRNGTRPRSHPIDKVSVADDVDHVEGSQALEHPAGQLFPDAGCTQPRN